MTDLKNFDKVHDALKAITELSHFLQESAMALHRVGLPIGKEMLDGAFRIETAADMARSGFNGYVYEKVAEREQSTHNMMAAALAATVTATRGE